MTEPIFTQYVRHEGSNPRLVTCADVDRKDHPSLTFVWTIPVQYEAQANGLPANGLSAAYKLEEQLTKALEKLGGFYMGHVTFSGAMTVVFRGPQSAPSEVEIKTGLLRKEKIAVTSREDPDWHWHERELAPSPLERHMSRNRGLLDHLAAQGDRPEVVRAVDFATLFPSDAARQAFLDAIVEEGYKLNREGKWTSDTGNFWCGIDKETSVLPEVIGECCALVEKQVLANNGEFDGWATHVMR